MILSKLYLINTNTNTNRHLKTKVNLCYPDGDFLVRHQINWQMNSSKLSSQLDYTVKGSK